MPKHSEVHDIEKLIVMVKNRPAIYDHSYPEHKNKEHTEMLWKQISDELNMSVKLCKSKWLALRNSFSREIRNEKESSCHPTLIKRKRRKWYLAEDMAFLRDYLNYGLVKRNSINDGQIEIEDDDNYGDDDSNSNDETCSSLPNVEKPEMKYSPKTPPPGMDENDIKLHSISSQDGIFETAHQTPSRVPSTTSKQPPKPQQQSHQDLTAENPIEDPFKEYTYPKRRRRCEEELNELREQNMSFFKSILPDILKLTERRQRLFKQEVLSVLNNSLDEQDMGS
ncbi:uncharacterized protein LOC129939984 [Eupeodes corollae]|uniref:uncharacterized protein LOC129939984 n=1 Tax=Eupeodes corollae TaxID=290404 RepID=UPI0024935D52|nr:uncharacterized protein LOC129939984 [Eupeodes corollae]